MLAGCSDLNDSALQQSSCRRIDVRLVESAAPDYGVCSVGEQHCWKTWGQGRVQARNGEDVERIDESDERTHFPSNPSSLTRANSITGRMKL